MIIVTNATMAGSPLRARALSLGALTPVLHGGRVHHPKPWPGKLRAPPQWLCQADVPTLAPQDSGTGCPSGSGVREGYAREYPTFHTSLWNSYRIP